MGDVLYSRISSDSEFGDIDDNSSYGVVRMKRQKKTMTQLCKL